MDRCRNEWTVKITDTHLKKCRFFFYYWHATEEIMNFWGQCTKLWHTVSFCDWYTKYWHILSCFETDAQSNDTFSCFETDAQSTDTFSPVLVTAVCASFLTQNTATEDILILIFLNKLYTNFTNSIFNKNIYHWHAYTHKVCV